METQNNPTNPENSASKSNTTLIIITILIIVVLAGAAYWFLGGFASSSQGERATSGVETVVEEKATSLGEEVYDAAQEQTAKELTENIPEVNPLEGVESNPFENYQNPFAR